MRLRYLLPLSLIAIAACQTELYPEAPTVPARTTTSSPAPDQGPVAPKPGYPDGQVVTSGQGWLEFAPLESQNNGGRLFFAFFPYDSQVKMPSGTAQVTGSAVITDSTGVKETKALLVYAPDPAGDPLIYCWPTIVSQRSYTLHVSLKVDGTAYTGDFTYRAK
ncbi:MAG TPA: hypothetical protein V6D05_07925 [Stenomitos sp.]